MTGEELIREVWRRWNSGDRELDPELIDPRFEVHSYLTGRIHRGEAQVKEWMAEIDQQFDAWELAIERVRMLSERRALAHGSIRGHGRSSGVELDEPAAWLIELADGRLVSIVNFIGLDAVEKAEASVL